MAFDSGKPWRARAFAPHRNPRLKTSVSLRLSILRRVVRGLTNIRPTKRPCLSAAHFRDAGGDWLGSWDSSQQALARLVSEEKAGQCIWTAGSSKLGLASCLPGNVVVKLTSV